MTAARNTKGPKSYEGHEESADVSRFKDAREAKKSVERECIETTFRVLTLRGPKDPSSASWSVAKAEEKRKEEKD